MPSPELHILDVGHGNCAVIVDLQEVVVIDCPQGPTLLEFLEGAGIREVESVMISHADEDHVAGLVALLAHEQIFVKTVYVNPDATKRTQVWQAVRIALEDAFQKRGTRARLGITTQSGDNLSTNEVEIEVLSPSLGEAMSGAGGVDIAGRPISSNSSSIVIGVRHESHRVALLPADIDDRSLAALRDRFGRLPADLIVFPHHGGHAGGANNESFAADLCSLTTPKLVVFSLSRKRLDNPREDIIRGIRSVVPEAHIMCTQLAKACANTLPISQPAHLTVVSARGREVLSCCGGSISVTLKGEASMYAPARHGHIAFIHINAPTARCGQ
jgi:beta-lactamase superfamily II metal-dependent hydrolase